MKFLVDQQLPPALAEWFRRQGQEAQHTEHIGLGTASDAEVWRRALEDGCIVVTKDGDFAAMRRSNIGPQILWLRIGNSSKAELVAHIERRWAQTLAFLEAGETIVQA
ncbi:MAG: DUF5615 family PIN-like protein [Caulobacteraceae bacterium]